jgi:branched-subunit amino acid transport protein
MFATQLSRLSPMFISSKFHMSESFERWLKYIPISVLTALIVPEFFEQTSGEFHINTNYLISGIVALCVGLWKKNMLLTTFVGVICLASLRFLA